MFSSPIQRHPIKGFSKRRKSDRRAHPSADRRRTSRHSPPIDSVFDMPEPINFAGYRANFCRESLLNRAQERALQRWTTCGETNGMPVDVKGEEVSLPMWKSFTTFHIVVHHFAVGVQRARYPVGPEHMEHELQVQQNKALLMFPRFWPKQYMQSFAFGPRNAMSNCLRSSYAE
jgi:hypothetical protein